MKERDVSSVSDDDDDDTHYLQKAFIPNLPQYS